MNKMKSFNQVLKKTDGNKKISLQIIENLFVRHHNSTVSTVGKVEMFHKFLMDAFICQFESEPLKNKDFSQVFSKNLSTSLILSDSCV